MKRKESGLLVESVVDESGWGLSEREHVERSVQESELASGGVSR